MSRFQSLSFSDSEPGLFSYAQIIFLLKTEFARARRYGIPVSCFILQIDRLDNLRDLYGYKTKEFILEKVVGLLKRESRACDFLGRAPDDRLLMIVPHTDKEGALVFSERLRSTISAFDFEAEGKAIKVTVSVGVSIYAQRNTLFYDSVVYAAEEATERAVALGGNQIAFQDPGGDGVEDDLEDDVLSED